MNKFSIPAFVEDLVSEGSSSKYSKAKLKMYYIGETVDHRVFTQDFSDKIISTIAYTPVVGFYSVADEDFVGHNNVQHIYGIVPPDATVEYQFDEQQNVTFAVTDIILYTGRPDETGAIAAKIVGKQHSLELDSKTVKYKLNYDENGNFKNLEFLEGELIGLSVLGDNEKPAFSGSEFFTSVEMPDFIKEDNIGKYEKLFTTLYQVEPTAEEIFQELERALESSGIYGYICEHKADDYVVVGYRGVYNKYNINRNESGSLEFVLESRVRCRFLSDLEIETLDKIKKGFVTLVTPDEKEESGAVVTAEAGAGSDPTPSVDNSGEGTEPQSDFAAELEALRGDYANLESIKNDLENNLSVLQNSAKNFLIDAYVKDIEFDASRIEGIDDIEEFVNILKTIKAEKEQESVVFEVVQIDNPPSYDENNEEDVVKKYKNMNRGKN